MTHIVWLMLTIFMISSKYHCDALIKESDKKNGTEMVDNSSTETSPYKLKGTEEYALEKLTFLGNDNSSINETEILENWFQFKHRFALQCTLVFLLLLCVMFLCFFPGKTQQVKVFCFWCLSKNYHKKLPTFTFCQLVE